MGDFNLAIKHCAMENKIIFAITFLFIIHLAECHLIIGRDLSQRKIFRSQANDEAAIPKQLSSLQRKSVGSETLKFKLAKMFARAMKKPLNKVNLDSQTRKLL